MSVPMVRARDTQVVKMVAGARSGVINFSDCESGGFVINGVWAAAKLSIEVSFDGVLFSALETEAGVRIDLIVSASGTGGRRLPNDLFGFPYFRFWSHNDAGVDVVQTATITASLKG